MGMVIMMKEKKQKNSFINDSFISIFGIIVCKIIGLLYVVPFYAMISTAGGALYSYAYSIYALFLSLSTSGIPVAMSKLVSEYDALEYNNTKKRIYKIGLIIISILGLSGFAILMIFANKIAYLIIGNMQGGNSIEDVALVIRTISTALLIVPALSVTKGYFQGHKDMVAASISNIIEQIARVAFLLLGCYLVLNVFKFDEKIAISVAVFSATIGAIIAYLYLRFRLHKKKNILFNTDISKEEKEFDAKYLAKQLIGCAIPFIIIDLLKSAYGMVDAFTVVRGLNSLGYSATISETALSVLATWGAKLTTIVVSVALGITMSLIPNIASDYIKGNLESVNKKINLSVIALLFITIPMTIGIAFLARPIWILFYSYNPLSISIFRLFIFTAASFAIYSVLINITQTLNHTKQVFIILAVSFLCNAIGNIPTMYLCHYLGINAYHGASICTLITELVPSIILIIYLKKTHGLKLKSLFSGSLKILLSSICMLATLFIISKIYPITSLTRSKAIIEVIIYVVIGALVYLVVSYKTGLIKDIIGNRFKKIKSRN